MEEKIKRPPSVWISQILLLLAAIVLGLSLFFRLMPFGFMSEKHPASTILPMLYELCASTLLFAAFIGMAKRKNVGRWLGVALLSLNCVATIYAFGQIAMDDSYHGKLMSRTTAAAFGCIVISLMLFLIYRLAFGSAANAFFAGPGAVEEPGISPTPNRSK